jgi:hypothetical protein
MQTRTTPPFVNIVGAGILLTIIAVTVNPVALAQDVPKNVNGPATALPAETYAAMEDTAYAIGVQAYIWGYPLVEMYRVRDASTAGPDPAGVNAPLNEFGHARRLVDDKLKLAHYPNADTLYSLAWLDLAKEPQVLHIPDTKGRYYVVPLCSAYNEIFASLGVRTKGYGEKRYAIVGPKWKAELPKGVEEVRSPTNLVWILNRTLINGPEELNAVHAIQDGYTLQPLSEFAAGKAPSPPKGFPAGTKPAGAIKPMPDGLAFFERLQEILQTEAVPERDLGLLNFFSLVGIGPDADFAKKSADPAIRAGLLRAAATTERLLKERAARLGSTVNGWQVMMAVGRYDDYLGRAAVAWMGGAGANLPEDGLYPMGFVDADGKPLDGRNRYALRFEKGQTPPVDGFWSLSMYGIDQNLVANPAEPFQHRRPHQGSQVRRRWIADDLHPVRASAHGARIQLATGASRPLRARDAGLLAEASDPRPQLQMAASAEGQVTSLLDRLRPAAQQTAAADRLQRPLRSRFRQRLSASVSCPAPRHIGGAWESQSLRSV